MRSPLLVAFGLAGLVGCAPPPAPIPQVTGSFAPATVKPGDTIAVTYTVTYAGAWADIGAAEITGFPVNSPTSGNLPLPGGSGVQATHNVVIRKPAMDGAYPLNLKVYYWGVNSPVVTNIGTLTIEDRPATISQVSLIANAHSVATDCVGNPLLTKQLRYRVQDDNGAADTYDPTVRSVLPVGLSNTGPPFPLAQTNSSSGTSETVDTSVDIRCDAPLGAYTWTVEISEDDKVAGTPPAVVYSGPITYTVNP